MARELPLYHTIDAQKQIVDPLQLHQASIARVDAVHHHFIVISSIEEYEYDMIEELQS